MRKGQCPGDSKLLAEGWEDSRRRGGAVSKERGPEFLPSFPTPGPQGREGNSFLTSPATTKTPHWEETENFPTLYPYLATQHLSPGGGAKILRNEKQGSLAVDHAASQALSVPHPLPSRHALIPTPQAPAPSPLGVAIPRTPTPKPSPESLLVRIKPLMH